MDEYALFRACFPALSLPREEWLRLISLDAPGLLARRERGELLGFALLEKNALRLLCVRPDRQGQGIGSALLDQAERRALSLGEQTLVVGGADSRLFPGAPEESWPFFEKRGFALGDAYAEMRGDLTAFRADAFSLPAPPNARFGWYRGPLDALRAAVAQVDEEWPRYFHADSPVFCAQMDGRIASFCSAEIWPHSLLSDGKNKVGAPGCVGTVPAFRRRGIGLKMVALACEELKKQGCDTGYIHYTGVAPWYEKLGFTVFLRWRRGEKRLV